MFSEPPRVTCVRLRDTRGAFTYGCSGLGQRGAALSSRIDARIAPSTILLSQVLDFLGVRHERGSLVTQAVPHANVAVHHDDAFSSADSFHVRHLPEERTSRVLDGEELALIKAMARDSRAEVGDLITLPDFEGVESGNASR